MFRRVQQCGFIPVFQSFGASPLELWEMKVQNGSIRRVTDEQLRALALELAGTNVSTCFAYCPRDPKATLGINMKYLVMIVKNLKKYFSFEITILDDTGAHRRFRLSNFQKVVNCQYFCTSLPLGLNPGWNEIYFNLAEFAQMAYKTRYVETTRIKINANCRVRVIYFCDKLYDDKDIPQKLKVFLPNTHKKKEEEPEKIKSVRGSEFELSQFWYEGLGEDYLNPTEALQAAHFDQKTEKTDGRSQGKSRPSTISLEASGIESDPIVDDMLSVDELKVEDIKQEELATDGTVIEEGTVDLDAPAIKQEPEDPTESDSIPLVPETEVDGSIPLIKTEIEEINFVIKTEPEETPAIAEDTPAPEPAETEETAVIKTEEASPAEMDDAEEAQAEG